MFMVRWMLPFIVYCSPGLVKHSQLMTSKQKAKSVLLTVAETAPSTATLHLLPVFVSLVITRLQRRRLSLPQLLAKDLVRGHAGWSCVEHSLCTLSSTVSETVCADIAMDTGVVSLCGKAVRASHLKRRSTGII